MSLPWKNRKRRLQDLLNSQGDEQEDGLALDRLLHGHHVIGKTARTTEIDQNRFQDADFRLVGALDYGQFGTIDVVNCRLNGRVYVRKTIEKKFAQRTREQCCPQIERDILIQAKLTDSQWAPHLLCAFQTTTHLKLVMEYAEGGTLWDVLESSPLEGRISEANVRWWAPQIVSAVHWCHLQGYVHRDIKPHNFVLKPHGHLLLIDFGSAAPLLSPLADGSQRLPKSHCLVPCGTCDYISPEILKAHEQALVALEMSGEVSEIGEDEAYGRETDWWSVGAMLYEMTYGVAPFFADDVRKTYAKIIDANRYVRFKASFTVSMALQRFIGGLLKDAEFRLGRRSINELTSHEFFQGVNWATLPAKNPPADLHTPQFTYADPNANLQDEVSELNDTKPFAFSELFQSSLGSSAAISILRDVASPGHSQDGNSSVFIGFSWGPTPDAFPGDAVAPPSSPRQTLRRPSSPIPLHTTPAPYILTTPLMNTQRLSTPLRSAVRTPFQTLSLNRNSTIRRTVARRAVSDREAFKQLADCVGMSARKRVLESGRKPRIIPTARSRSGSFKKELRFYPTPGEPDKIPVNGTDTEETDTDMDSDGPPSPSPSPRPGSSMSRRSATPTVTGTFSKMMLGDVSQRTFSDVSLRSRRDSFRQNSLVDDLEMKHVSLMRNIRSLEQRLEMLSSTVEDD